MLASKKHYILNIIKEMIPISYNENYGDDKPKPLLTPILKFWKCTENSPIQQATNTLKCLQIIQNNSELHKNERKQKGKHRR